MGNCLNKNGKEEKINGLNHTLTSQGSYFYDANGNLTNQSDPPACYTYDALNRLIYSNRKGKETFYVYDAFNRCLQIKGASGTQQLIYQQGKWREMSNIEIIKPNNYEPGRGTGFLPGELFPGLWPFDNQAAKPSKL